MHNPDLLSSQLISVLMDESLSAHARMVRMSMIADPSMSPTQVAKRLGIGRSTVYRALDELSQVSQSGTATVPSVPERDGKVSQVSHCGTSQVSQVSQSGTLAKEKSPHTPLKENTNQPLAAGALGEVLREGANLQHQQQQAAGCDEIAGLNGKTPTVIARVAQWLPTFARPDAARRIAETYVADWGAEKVLIGTGELEAQWLAGRIEDPMRALPQFCKNARGAAEIKPRPGGGSQFEGPEQRYARAKAFLDKLAAQEASA